MKTCLALIVSIVSLVATGCVRPSSITRTGDIRAPGIDEGYGSALGDIENMVRQTMSRKRIPGLSIVLVNSRGPIWEAGFGYGDDARKVPVDGNTIFSIQSMSKTFTSVGVLTAVRDGLVDLDTPISRYLPDFKIQSILNYRLLVPGAPGDRRTHRLDLRLLPEDGEVEAGRGGPGIEQGPLRRRTFEVPLPSSATLRHIPF
jgi:CubicO group peptidase (beta-lactamase class C family)